jgi:hypothetical protein
LDGGEWFLFGDECGLTNLKVRKTRPASYFTLYRVKL